MARHTKYMYTVDRNNDRAAAAAGGGGRRRRRCRGHADADAIKQLVVAPDADVMRAVTDGARRKGTSTARRWHSPPLSGPPSSPCPAPLQRALRLVLSSSPLLPADRPAAKKPRVAVPPPLDAAALARFRRDGFVLLRDAFPPSVAVAVSSNVPQ